MMLAIFSIGLTHFSAKADAAVYVSVSSSSVSVGSNVTVSLSVSGGDISAYTLYLSYDSSVLSFNSVSGAIGNGGGGSVTISGTGAGNVSISFTAVGEGTSGIYTSGEFYDINFNVINVSYGSASVTVGGSTQPQQTTTEEDNRSKNNYLSSLEVSVGTLDPAFDSSITEYTLRVAENTTEVGISAYPSDSKSKISVSGNTDLTPGIHYIEVTCTAENGYYRVYTIKVVVGEVLEDTLINVDGVDYNLVTDADEIEGLEEFEIPEGFSKSSAKYGKWDILVYKSKTGSVLLACMKDAEGNYGWFRYDEKKEEFSKYIEYKLDTNRYVLLNIPEGTVMPEGYILTEITIAGQKITAYTSEELGENYYIIYAVNIMGDEGFYLYDSVEGNIIRYVIATATDADDATELEPVATETDAKSDDESKILTKSQFMIACIAIGSVLLILIILLIIFAVKINMFKHKDEDDNEDEAETDEIPQLVVAAAEEATEEAAEEAAEQADEAAEETDEEKEQAEAVTEETAEITDKATEEAVTEEITEAVEETAEPVEETATEEITEPAAEVENTEPAEESIEAKEETAEEADEKVDEVPRKKKKSSFEISDAEEDITVSIQSEAEKEQFENLAKEIEEKINSDYDASLDSAFADNE